MLGFLPLMETLVMSFLLDLLKILKTERLNLSLLNFNLFVFNHFVIFFGESLMSSFNWLMDLLVKKRPF